MSKKDIKYYEWFYVHMTAYDTGRPVTKYNLCCDVFDSDGILEKTIVKRIYDSYGQAERALDKYNDFLQEDGMHIVNFKNS